jgi:regulator of sigma E protease
MLLAAIAIILTLLLVVGIHEAGHALVAHLFGVKIKKISIGFGRSLLSWKSRSGCEWVWAFFPLGGYVQLQNTRISPVAPSEYSQCFDKKPVGPRILILLAGALANLILTWIAFVLVYSIGLHYTLPEIQEVHPQTVAAQAGLLPGDRFMAVGDEATATWSDVGMQLIRLWGKKDIQVSVNRQGQPEKVLMDLSQIRLGAKRVSLLAQIGVKPNASAPKEIFRASSLLEAMHQANTYIVKTTYFFLIILKQLVSGVIPFSLLLGPVGIFAVSIASLTQGILFFILFIGTLSLAVALINLIPIPGLDGGSIVYTLIEKIRGKPISVAMEVLLYRLAFIMFCVLLVHLLMNDLQRI